MARPTPANRLGIAGSNAAGVNLAAFATPQAEPEPQQARPAAVDDYTDFVDTVDSSPAPAKKRAVSEAIVRKNYPMEKAFCDELLAARKKWHMEDPDRMDTFGGMASENAFLQAVARLGMEQIERNQKAAARLLRLFPTNTRTR
jgi:hypothetical protein